MCFLDILQVDISVDITVIMCDILIKNRVVLSQIMESLLKKQHT